MTRADQRRLTKTFAKDTLKQRKNPITQQTICSLDDLVWRKIKVLDKTKIRKILNWMLPIKIGLLLPVPENIEFFWKILPAINSNLEWRISELKSSEKIEFARGEHPLVLIALLAHAQTEMYKHPTLFEALLTLSEHSYSREIITLMSNPTIERLLRMLEEDEAEEYADTL